MEDIVELMRNEKEDYGAAYECGVMDGEKRGEARGEKRGEKRGKKIGINEGIKKRNAEIAKSMYRENIDLSTISRVTNLGITELQGMFKIN